MTRLSRALFTACVVCGAAFASLAGAQPTAPTAATTGASDTLRVLYESEYAWRQQQQGKIKNPDGKWVDGENLPRVDAATQSAHLDYWEKKLAALSNIPREELDREDRINADVFRQIVATLADEVRFRSYETPFNSDTFFWTGLYPRLGGFDDLAAYGRYAARLHDLDRYFGEHIVNMRAGLQRGYSVPRITLRGREASIEAYLAPGRKNPFWTPMTDMPASISPADREALQLKVAEAIDKSVVPAYRRLLTFFREEYMPSARTTLAASELPDGEAFYRAQIHGFTTLDLTPEAIHEQGLAEVARIRSEMLSTIEATGFDGEFAAFLEFLRNDPQFYARTGRELLSYSAYVAKRADGKLGDVIGFLPRRRFTILPVPEALAPFYTSGRGGLDSCLMNTHDLPSRPLYNLPALTLHECAPGHALQAAIAREAPGDIPEFRRDNYFSGYGEGWGLYTEWLGTLDGGLRNTVRELRSPLLRDVAGLPPGHRYRYPPLRLDPGAGTGLPARTHRAVQSRGSHRSRPLYFMAWAGAGLQTG